MMAFAPPKSTDGPKMQTKMSTWTPLNHQLLNDQVFEERRALLGKWFDKWTDSQRRRILASLLERCSLSQQKFCCRKLQEQIPAEALDFTTKLPRVLSVYIFSFLDPRSLCRCAQVSWHWKNLSELDQLWMLKCLRFNWRLDFSPSPFEQGVWKKHYIQMVKKLHVTKPKTPPKDGFVITNVQPVASSSPGDRQSPFRSSSTRRKNNPGERELPPWRSSDKHPTDIIRFNYLDNCDSFQPSSQGRRRRSEMTPDFSQQSHDKKNKLQDRARLRKAQSLTNHHQPRQDLPQQAPLVSEVNDSSFAHRELALSLGDRVAHSEVNSSIQEVLDGQPDVQRLNGYGPRGLIDRETPENEAFKLSGEGGQGGTSGRCGGGSDPSGWCSPVDY